MKTYLCTRASLASILLDSGEEGHVVANPFNTSLMAWQFKITPTLVQTVSSFYQDIGKPIPSSLIGVTYDE